MKILIVHQYFLGKDDAGGSRWNQFAKYWAEAGHEITILAGMVHYTQGRSRRSTRASSSFASRNARCDGLPLPCQRVVQQELPRAGLGVSELRYQLDVRWPVQSRSAGRDPGDQSAADGRQDDELAEILASVPRRVRSARPMARKCHRYRGHPARPAGQHALSTGAQGLPPRGLDQRAHSRLRRDAD